MPIMIATGFLMWFFLIAGISDLCAVKGVKEPPKVKPPHEDIR